MNSTKSGRVAPGQILLAAPSVGCPGFENEDRKVPDALRTFPWHRRRGARGRKPGKGAHSCPNVPILQIYEHLIANYIEIEYIFVIISIEFIVGYKQDNPDMIPTGGKG